MNITEDKLKAAIQIALGMRGIYTEEIESALVHHVKALSITDVVVSEAELCENCKYADSCGIRIDYNNTPCGDGDWSHN